MGDMRDILSGYVVLTNERTGEVYRLAVLIAPDDDKITYTGQSMDYTRRRTASWHRSDCPAFLEMMEIVDEVTALDRRIA